MKEPLIRWPSRGVPEWTSYSQAPIHVLQNVSNSKKNPGADEFYDKDFRMRYAAILLRERGL